MPIISRLVTMVVLVSLVGSVAGDDRPGKGVSSPLLEEQTSIKLRAEAARLETSHSSTFFSTLISKDAVTWLKLSPSQVELIGRIDRVVRDVQKAWLIRGLDAKPTPASSKLAERLAENGRRLRADLVAHTEAIVLEGVLEPDQARLLLRKLGGRLPSPMEGRHPSKMFYVNNGEFLPEDLRGFDLRIRGEERALRDPMHWVPASELYRILLDIRKENMADLKSLSLSNDQSELIRRLDKLIRDVPEGLASSSPRRAGPASEGTVE